MTAAPDLELIADRYGKSAVRLVKVTRSGDHHTLKDLEVELTLGGDFAAAHEAGDNSRVLPTDTMKNLVYALAADSAWTEIEPFADALAAALLDRCPAADAARVAIAERLWGRIDGPAGPHPHAFASPAGERRSCSVERRRGGGGAAVTAGITGLALLKSAGSAFTGFLRDDLTTLPETEDRILATDLTARWRYGGGELPHGLLWRGIRSLLLATFADHDSRSVQHTLYTMAEAVLATQPAVEEIYLALPNRHHLAVDLTPFGRENRDQVFVATSEPYGRIEATLRRRGA